MNNAILQAKKAMEKSPTAHHINNYLWQVYLHKTQNNTTPASEQYKYT
jgi:hypothetical protein